MPDAPAWIAAVRASHDRLTGLLEPLDADQVTAPAYPSEWSIADVASHLGSQSEIFDLYLDAAFAGDPIPGREVFGPIWDRWNATPPLEQVSNSIATNESFVQRLENLSDEQKAAFPIALFGRDMDLLALLATRLGEHAMHTWDVEVAIDPAAGVAPGAADLLIDGLSPTAARVSVAVGGLAPVAITTTGPQRFFALTIDSAVSLAPVESADASADALELPAEALLRLVYGRLDPDHTPDAVTDEHDRLGGLRTVFPGF